MEQKEQTKGNWQWAVLQLDLRKKVTREGWGDSSAFIRKVDFHNPTEIFSFGNQDIPKGTWPPCMALHLTLMAGTVDRWSFYAPTQLDMLAQDWIVVS